MTHFSAPQLAALVHWKRDRVESTLSAFRILPDKFSGKTPLYGERALRCLENQKRLCRLIVGDFREAFGLSPVTPTAR